jgi:hypothetical protein
MGWLGGLLLSQAPRAIPYFFNRFAKQVLHALKKNKAAISGSLF